MLGIHDFPLFVLSCILLNMTPGQDTLYIVGRSLAQGKRAGMLSAMGIMTGVLVHTVLAAMGLSAILATSALAYSVVKYVGAAYLIWMGIGFILNRENRTTGPVSEADPLDPWKIYRQGVVTNVLNPKVALFFLSFLPQFVSVDARPVFLPFMALGLVFFTSASIWCLFLIAGTDWLHSRIGGGSAAGGVLKKMAGLLFVGLGIRLALSRAHM